MPAKKTAVTLQARVESFVAAWVPRLGLRDWVIRVVVDGDASSDYFMRTSRSNEAMRATIRVSPDCEEEGDGSISAPDMEQQVVHELLHVSLGHYTLSISDQLEAVAGRGTPLTRAITSQMYDLEEHVCDQISIALVREWKLVTS